MVNFFVGVSYVIEFTQLKNWDRVFFHCLALASFLASAQRLSFQHRRFIHTRRGFYGPQLVTALASSKFWADVRLVFANATTLRRPSVLSLQKEGSCGSCRSLHPTGLSTAQWRQYTQSSRSPLSPPFTRKRTLATVIPSRARSPLSADLLLDSSLSVDAELHPSSLPSPLHAPLSPGVFYDAPTEGESRFDWRLRAASRRRAVEPAPGENRQTRRFVRRVEPQTCAVQPGERFHDEIETYQERCVYLPYLCGSR